MDMLVLLLVVLWACRDCGCALFDTVIPGRGTHIELSMSDVYEYLVLDPYRRYSGDYAD